MSATVVVILVTIHRARRVRSIILGMSLPHHWCATPTIITTLPVHDYLLGGRPSRSWQMLLVLCAPVVRVVGWVDVAVVEGCGIR